MRFFPPTTVLVLTLFLPAISVADEKPIKVFILAGQSNMQGHARIETFDYIGDDPETASLLQMIRNDDGTPRVSQRVWISYLTGEAEVGDAPFERLTSGFGARSTPWESEGKIGPELTFGFTVEQAVEGPVVIIKTAWGGKSLFYDFRPPSAGPYRRTSQDVQQDRNPVDDAGRYYRLMIGHVRHVLENLDKTLPGYDANRGYEIAGFVWFQGWNDMVNRDIYPLLPRESEANRFADYGRWLGCLIRDVRKDLGVDRLPVVIGVMGVGGKQVEGDQQQFRQAMMAPANLPEFQGNVAVVATADFWDDRLGAIDDKYSQVRQMAYLLRTEDKNAANKDGTMSEEEQKEYLRKFEADLISPAEVALRERGASNAGYHYLGSAKTFALIGRAFAESALALMEKDSQVTD
jgi:hypothetical protein